MLATMQWWRAAITVRLEPDSEQGFGTAELLGNAALGIAVLVVIWALLQGLGSDVVGWIRGQIVR